MYHSTDRIVDRIAFVTPIVEYWQEQEIAQLVHCDESIWWPIAPWTDVIQLIIRASPINQPQGFFHKNMYAADATMAKMCLVQY